MSSQLNSQDDIELQAMIPNLSRLTSSLYDGDSGTRNQNKGRDANVLTTITTTNKNSQISNPTSYKESQSEVAISKGKLWGPFTYKNLP